MNPLTEELIQDLPSKQIRDLIHTLQRELARREMVRIETKEIQRQIE
jgi:hypothetical protein